MIYRIENLSYSYDGHRKALDNISLEFHEGEFVVILGRNGAGKTTLFKNLLGLLKPQSGSVSIDSVDFFSLPIKERAKRLAYIPQESSPGFSYTVLTVVLMGTTNSISTLSSPSIKEEKRAIEALEKFGIAHLAERRIDRLSGGERQLVMCARAIAQKAGILLFDEPTSNLDWANQIRTLDTISSLTKEGYLAIVSTHNLEQALNVAHRIVLMEEGRVVSVSTPAELSADDTLSRFYGMPLRIDNLDGHYVCIPKGGTV